MAGCASSIRLRSDVPERGAPRMKNGPARWAASGEGRWPRGHPPAPPRRAAGLGAAAAAPPEQAARQGDGDHDEPVKQGASQGLPRRRRRAGQEARGQ